MLRIFILCSEDVGDPLVDEGEFDLPDLPEVFVEPPVDVDIEGPGEPDTVVEGSGVPAIEDYLPVGTGGGSGVDSPSPVMMKRLRLIRRPWKLMRYFPMSLSCLRENCLKR